MRKNIFCISLSLLITLLVCEISYRFYEFYFYRRQLRKLDEIIIESLPNEPILQYKLKPNTSFLHVNKILYKINSQGLRDYEFSSYMNKNTYRVIILGDSYTFGWKVDIENIFPKILETLLNQDGYSAQVINAGVYGYNTQLEVLFFKKYLLQYNPNLVIIAFFPNDTQTQGAVPMHPFYRHCESYYHSWFIEFIKSRINRFINRDKKNNPDCRGKEGDFYPIKVRLANPCEVPIEEAFSDTFFGYRRFKESLGEIKKLSDEKKFDLCLLILPDFAKNFNDYIQKNINEKVKEYSESIGIEAIDLYKYFKDKNNLELQLLEFADTHPNKIAHRILGDKLFLELKNLPKIKCNLDNFRR